MNSTLFQLMVSLGTLVFLAAKWTGVILLRRGSGKFPWGLMLAGVIFSTVAHALPMLRPLLGTVLYRSVHFYDWSRLLPQFGNVTFAVGFALYGLQMARASQRQEELATGNSHVRGDGPASRRPTQILALGRSHLPRGSFV